MQLEERSPLRLLERGYAICYGSAGNVVQAADQVAVGEEIRVQLARGRLGAEVRKRELTDAGNLQGNPEPAPEVQRGGENLAGPATAAENLQKK